MSKKDENQKKDVPAKLESSGPFQEPEKRMHDMENRFEDFFSADWMHPSTWELPDWAHINQIELKVPKKDIVDRDEDVLVRVHLPGVKKEDFDVSLSDNTVTVKGSTSEEKKEEKGDYLRCEISRGEFSRTGALPHYVDSDAAKARFSDGVLELTMPKVEKAKRHSIKVE